MHESDIDLRFKPRATKLSTDLARLVQQELELGRIELESKLQRLQNHVMSLTTGRAVFVGTLTLIGAAVFVLAESISVWVAALLVGGLTLVLGTAMHRAYAEMAGVKLQPIPSDEAARREIELSREATR